MAVQPIYGHLFTSVILTHYGHKTRFAHELILMPEKKIIIIISFYDRAIKNTTVTATL